MLDVSDNFHDLEHFYEHQKLTWEKLRKAYDAFKLNQLDLERDPNAAPAMRRMQEILSAKSPYSQIKEVETLVSTVQEANTSLLQTKRTSALQKINAQIESLRKDIEAANAPTTLATACLSPLERLRDRVNAEQSLAHISQVEAESTAEYDKAIDKFEAFCAPPPSQPDKVKEETETATPAAPVIRKQRVVKPADLMTKSHLESADDVTQFLNTLKSQLDSAISNNERIQIR